MCNRKKSTSTLDPILCLEVNLGKILIGTLKLKKSYCSYIMILYIQHVIFLRCIMYFLYR